MFSADDQVFFFLHVLRNLKEMLVLLMSCYEAMGLEINFLKNRNVVMGGSNWGDLVHGESCVWGVLSHRSGIFLKRMSTGE